MMLAAQLGISGTVQSCTPMQLISLREVLLGLVREGTWEMHHSDLLGSTESAHEFWRACRQRVVVHPSTGNSGRALLDHDEKKTALPARERDIALARATQAIVHIPGEGETYDDHGVFRAARRLGRPMIVVHPSGNVQQWTNGLVPMDPKEETPNGQ